MSGIIYGTLGSAGIADKADLIGRHHMNPLVVVVQSVQISIRPNEQHRPGGATDHGSEIQFAQRCRVIKDRPDIATFVGLDAAVIVALGKYLRDRIGVGQLAHNHGSYSDKHHRERYCQNSPLITPLGHWLSSLCWVWFWAAPLGRGRPRPHLRGDTPIGELVWEYINPFLGQSGFGVGGSISGLANSVFRAHRYGYDHPALVARDLNPDRYANLNRLFV